LATGHGGDEEGTRIDWQCVAVVGQPIVLYMALRRIGAIAGRLMSAGLEPQTPVSIVSWATTSAQCVIDTTLARAGADVASAETSAPAIIAIGENVALRRALAAGIVPLVPSP
jgi:uroporphyrin-III C-methyltransferase